MTRLKSTEVWLCKMESISFMLPIISPKPQGHPPICVDSSLNISRNTKRRLITTHRFIPEPDMLIIPLSWWFPHCSLCDECCFENAIVLIIFGLLVQICTFWQEASLNVQLLGFVRFCWRTNSEFLISDSSYSEVLKNSLCPVPWVWKPWGPSEKNVLI